MNRPNIRNKASILMPFLMLVVFAVSIQASTIEGIIYDQNLNPLRDVDVELKNELGQVRGRTRSNSYGRYQFPGLADGRWYVKVFAFRYNLQDAEQMVPIDTVRVVGGIGNTIIQRDFYLKPRRGRLADTTTGVVFTQEVPEDAEAHFKAGTKLIGEKKMNAGMQELVKAVKVFPKYYAAWKRLGASFLASKQPLEAAKAFMNAANANPKSSYAFYYMGISFAKVGKDYYPAALVAFGKAEAMAKNEPAIPLELGKVHRKLGNVSEAEVQLLKAKSMSVSGERILPQIHRELTELYSNDMKQYGKAAKELEAYMRITKQTKNADLKAQLKRLKDKARNSE